MTLTPASLRRLEEGVGALIASHQQTSRATDFSRYVNDPVGFMRDVLKADPWSMQVEVAEAVRDHPRVVVRGGNGLGKDHAAARIALWWAYARRGLAIITGPTERQCREIVMGEVRRAFHAADDLPGDLYEMALRMDRSEHAGIFAFTAGDVSKLAGIHAPNLLVIVTEAQGIEEWTWQGIFGCATGDQSRILAVGNPLEAAGRFFNLCHSAQWVSRRVSALEHPNLIEGREVIPGAVTRAWVEMMAAEYGPGSSVYQSRVLGEFPTESDEALCSRAAIREAFRRHEQHELEGLAEGQPWVLGLDVARYGEDASVLAAGQGPIVRELVTWRKRDLMELTGLVLLECERLGVRLRDGGITEAMAADLLGLRYRCWDGIPKATDRLYVDEAGLGAGLFDRLREQKLALSVKGFNGGRSPSEREKDRCLNMRAECMWAVRELVEEGRVAIQPNERLLDELASTRWKVNSRGVIQIEAKDELRSRLGRSPDTADAVAMVLWDYWLKVKRRRSTIGGSFITF